MQAQYKFFRDLANDDDEKFNELITFCRHFLNNTFTKPIINISGPGSNGKTTLLDILQQVTELHTYKSPHSVSSAIYFVNNITYYIFEAHDVTNYVLIDQLKELNSINQTIKYIILSNTPISTNDWIKEKSINLKMDTVFGSNPDQKKADYNIKQKMLLNKELFVDFVLNYQMAWTDSDDDSSEEEFISKKDKVNDKINGEIDISICI